MNKQEPCLCKQCKEVDMRLECVKLALERKDDAIQYSDVQILNFARALSDFVIDNKITLK